MRSIAALALALALLLPQSLGAEPSRLEVTGQFLLSTVAEPTVSSVGGEWTVIGLARSGLSAPDGYYEGYLSRLTAALRAQNGVLHERKYTEYARVTLALTALGENPRNVAGYDLVAPLLDAEAVTAQGINGLIWATLALNAGQYDKEAAAAYAQRLLAAQLADGGWSLTGRTPSDGDITAMAVQALAPYRGEAANALANALLLLQAQEHTLTLEGWVQRIVAQCSLGEAVPQAWIDALLAYQLADGSFFRSPDREGDLMSTEQGFYALVALARQGAGQAPLYDMTNELISVDCRWAIAHFRASGGIRESVMEEVQ